MSNSQTPKLHQTFGPLFKRVQESGLFKDCKTWVDVKAKSDYESILNAYLAALDDPDFELEDFVHQHFELPSAPPSSHCASPKKEDMFEHIEHLWDSLKRTADQANTSRESLLPLPQDYIVPGGRFREIYYWDTYFTAEGLAASNRFDLIEHMLDNFSHLVDTYGHIPNGNRSYYLTRSQPPVFGCFVKLYVDKFGAQQAKAYIESLAREYDFWMAGAQLLTRANPEHRRVVRMPDGEILNRYWDEHNTPREESYREDTELRVNASPGEAASLYRNLRAAAESGWDFSSRWCVDPKKLHSIETTRLVPVDLNGWLYLTELYLSEFHEALDLPAIADLYRDAAATRKEALLKYTWNKELGFFFDYHLDLKTTTNRWALSGVMPLFASIATPAQAKFVAKHLENEFLKHGGFVTTLVNSSEQWDAPNGWAPLQWLAVKGLLNYDHKALAKEGIDRWLHTNEALFHETGRMMEKYNVEAVHVLARGGEYPSQDGFGWTNGIALKFREILG
jgi:alpha,alpha-trehalase